MASWEKNRLSCMVQILKLWESMLLKPFKKLPKRQFLRVGNIKLGPPKLFFLKILIFIDNLEKEPFGKFSQGTSYCNFRLTLKSHPNRFFFNIILLGGG